MASYILIAIILFSGFIAKLEEDRRFSLLKSVVLVATETNIGSMFFAFCFSYFQTASANGFDDVA